MGAIVVSLLAAVAAAEGLRRRRDARRRRTLTSAAQALALGDLTEHPLPPTAAGAALALVRDGHAHLREERDRATAERERRADAAFRRRREAEEQTRTRARTMLDETAALVLDELGRVRAEVEAVRAAAGSIDAQAGSVDDVARDVVTRSRETAEGAETLIAHLRDVGGVVAVIAAVADQTRLLALNATIEAVRAGEAGRSFAVVASEVKDLATTTARSTEQISATIADLERIADRVAASLGVMTDGVTGLDDSTHALAGVAAGQQSAVGRLEQAVAAAVGRIEALARLEELERPTGGRIRVSLPAVLQRAGHEEQVTVEDLATGGAGLRLPSGSVTATGDDVVLAVTLDSHPCRLPGTVKVVRPDRTAGIAFGDLPPDARDAVENAIAAQDKAQTAPSAR